MKNKAWIIAGSGLIGLVAGYAVISSNTARILSLAGVLSIPAGITGKVVSDRLSQSQINSLQERLQATRNEVRQLPVVKARLASCESASKRLENDLNEATALLKQAKLNEEFWSGQAGKFKGDVANLEWQIGKLQESLGEAKDQLADYEAHFEQALEDEVSERVAAIRSQEIQQIFDEHDAVTSQAMALFRRLQDWAVKVQSRHHEQRDFIFEMAGGYNRNLEELSSAVEEERSHYVSQIEALNVKVARLRQQLAGDLTEPSYFDCGFDPNGQIVNAIAEWLWNHHRIPLRVTGFEESGGIITAGYSYSRSVNPEALSKAIEDNSPAITRFLGLYALEKAQKLPIADVLTVKIRRERPQRKTDKGSLYRSKEDFIDYILSQPLRLRIIGEPGAGKTPTVAILLSHLLTRGFLSGNTPNGQKLPYTIVESCNPLAGISVKNGDALDFCLKWETGAKGFKGLADEYRFRKNLANSDYKNQVGYIWIADEIDNTMASITKDEAKPFKDSLKDGGHVNIGVIVMGQSANVSTSKGLSIDDQKMMTNLYIDPVSIRTFLTQYGERFYSKKAVERALNTLEELELEIEEQNELICDTAREFRIAMVTASRSPIFYQLPYFDSAQIDVDTYLETVDKVTGIREGRGGTGASHPIAGNLDTASDVPMSGRSPYAGSGTGTDIGTKPTCPHCGSDNIRSKGNKWACQNPEHSKLAPKKPKSWKK